MHVLVELFWRKKMSTNKMHTHAYIQACTNVCIFMDYAVTHTYVCDVQRRTLAYVTYYIPTHSMCIFVHDVCIPVSMRV
jgi:hypothetical protein